MPTYLSRVRYSADGSTNQFAVPFGYIERAHVSGFVDGTPAALVWINAGLVEIDGWTPAELTGRTVALLRATSPEARLVDYTVPSTLTEEDLDADSLQAFYLAQEATDTVQDSITRDPVDNLWDAQSARIKNLPGPTAATDAANKAYVDSTIGGSQTAAAAAAASAAEAAASASAAASSASAAAASAGAADASADAAAASAATLAALIPALPATVEVVTGVAVSAVAGKHYILTNAAATTVTLPATPAAGDTIAVTVANGRLDNLIALNGNELAGEALTYLKLDNKNATIGVRFVDSTRDWRFA